MKNTPSPCPICHRRSFLVKAALGSATFLTTKGAFAEALLQTPFQTEGPFYPDKLPLDTDNDLLVINNSITPSVGDVTHLTGTVRDIKGKPVRNAVVEAWEADANGCYNPHRRRRQQRQTRQKFPGLRPLPSPTPKAATTSAPSNPSPTARAPHTSTWPSSRGTSACSPPSATSKATRSTKKTARSASSKPRPNATPSSSRSNPFKNSKNRRAPSPLRHRHRHHPPEDRDQDSGRRLRGNAGRPQ